MSAQPNPAPTPAASSATADEPPRIALRGLTQIDWVIHRQSSEDQIDAATGEPFNQDRLLLRRGRLGTDAEYEVIGGRLELDANTVRGFSVRPFEAVISARYPTEWSLERAAALHDERAPRECPEFAVFGSAGLRPIPFGFDAVERDAVRPFLERTLVSQAFFGQARDFGIGVDVLYRFLLVSAAFMNGEPLSDERYAGRDLTRAKDLVGRAGVLVSQEPFWLRAGASWLWGKGLHRGTAEAKGSLVWIDGNEDGLVDATELIPVPAAPATPSKTFERSALGGDLQVGVTTVLGATVLRAELARALNLDRTLTFADPVAVGRELREWGGHLGLTQELTSHAEVGLRYELYQPDSDATRQKAVAVVPADRSYRTLSLSAAGKLSAGRLSLQYDHRRNALGRGVNGAPTTLRDDAVTLRMEVRLR